jgi:hypothetical protein
MLRQSAFFNWRTTGATGAVLGAGAPVRQCASPFRDGVLERRGTPVLHGLLQFRISDWRKHSTGADRAAPPPATMNDRARRHRACSVSRHSPD